MLTRNPAADEDCYGCKGTGRIIGFGHGGKPCPCVHHCENCDAQILREEYDEGCPRQGRGGGDMCESCRKQEDAVLDMARQYAHGTATEIDLLTAAAVYGRNA